jgi:hypothetical protein
MKFLTALLFFATTALADVQYPPHTVNGTIKATTVQATTVQADNIANKAGTGAPTLTYGFNAPFKVVNSAYNAVSGDRLLADSSGGAFTITLPTGAVGANVEICDAAAYFEVNNVTVARNSSNIQGVAQNLVLNVTGTCAKLVYFNISRGWDVF